MPGEVDSPGLFGGDSPRTTESSRPALQTDFRSRLSALGRAFVAINVGDYAGLEKFIKQNPDVFDIEESDLLKEAQAALVAGKDAYATCCVQQSLLLRELCDYSSKERKKFFEKLIGRDRTATRDFLSDRDGAMRRLRERIPATTERPAPQSSDLSVDVAGLLLSDPSARHRDNIPSRDPAPMSDPRVGADTFPRHGTTPSGGRGGPTGPIHPRETISNISNAPTWLGPDRQVETLDARYQVRKNANGYFTFGRVFATLWHTSTGIARNDHKRGEWVREGRFGEQVLSHIQRMAVVKEDHGYSWCIPINTYNGKGLAKPGLNERDRQAHAIIHMEGTQPQYAPREPRSAKKPISVRPAAADQRLDPMSRVHFGKVHTVEHNVKVMNVGNITGTSLEYFEGYWNAKANEENRHDDRV